MELVNRLKERVHGFLVSTGNAERFSFCQREVDFSLTGTIASSFLVGANTGLLHYADGELERILPGPIYGITRRNGFYYVLQRLGKSSRVLKFRLVNAEGKISVDELSVFVRGLSVGVHQIDFIGSVLFLADTYHNSILLVNDKGVVSDCLYPNGRLRNDDLFSRNYAHYNSIFWDGQLVHVVAHNNSIKTGRPSEVHSLDPCESYQIVSKRKNIGYCAHNIICRPEGEYWCDSLRSTVLKNDKVVATIDNSLTRGLAIDESNVVVGASAVAFGRNRLNSNGRVVCYDLDFNKTGELAISGSGGISEIRMLGVDFGLSESNLSSEISSVLPLMG